MQRSFLSLLRTIEPHFNALVNFIGWKASFKLFRFSKSPWATHNGHSSTEISLLGIQFESLWDSKNFNQKPCVQSRYGTMKPQWASCLVIGQLVICVFAYYSTSERVLDNYDPHQTPVPGERLLHSHIGIIFTLGSVLISVIRMKPRANLLRIETSLTKPVIGWFYT